MDHLIGRPVQRSAFDQGKADAIDYMLIVVRYSDRLPPSDTVEREEYERGWRAGILAVAEKDMKHATAPKPSETKL